MNRELLCDWLETEGHEVSSAEDLKSAMRSIEELRPHAVLLDVQLGDDDGLELATVMRKHAELCSIPVIAVTAHALVTEQSRFLQAGCRDPLQLSYWNGGDCLRVDCGSAASLSSTHTFSRYACGPN